MSALSRKIAIGLLPDEPGHRRPLLTLAMRLRRRGHDVCFVGGADDSRAIEQAGFRFFTLAEKAFPEGHWAARKADVAAGRRILRHTADGVMRLRRAMDEIHDALPALRKEAFDLFLGDAQLPHLTLLALALPTRCALLHTSLWMENRALPPMWSDELPRPDGRLGLRARWDWLQLRRRLHPIPVLFKPVLLGLGLRERDWFARFAPRLGIGRFRDLHRILPNLVACPAAFDLPFPRPSQLFYLDALVGGERERDGEFDWSGVPDGRRTIYLSMGTQAWLMKRPLRFFQAVFDAVAARPDWHLIVSTGRFVKLDGIAPPPNVELHGHVAQLRVLERADVMITHAGLNTVKECILAGVPMIAFPVERDQPGNAVRIEYHRIGVRGSYRNVTAEGVRGMIEAVLSDAGYRRRVEAMGEEFRAAERRDDSVRAIEALLRRVAPGAADAGDGRAAAAS
jgi:UDP:flavonoid glycosyltransferase YjiC (YdhE family)